MNIRTLSLVLAASATLLTACSKDKEVKETPFPEETIAVKVAPITQENASNSVTATGLVTTENQANYAFKIGGIIDRVLVKEGQSFRKGQLLATLKLTEIEAQSAQAKLGWEKAQRDHQRVKNLYADSVATLEQFQNSQTALEVAQKTYEAVKFNQQYASIYAENNGFVTKLIAHEGEVIGGGYPVMAINETNGQSGWVLKVGVSDREWASIAQGGNSTVHLDAFPGEVFPASVLRKSLAANPTSGSFEVELKLQPGKHPLALGMYGKATIETTAPVAQTVIPYDALIEADGKNAFVFVPEGKSVRKVPVVVDQFDTRQVVVASGLENVKQVVVSNSAFLNEKSTITIVQ